MAGIGHVAVGGALAHFADAGTRSRRVINAAALSGLALLPDLDVIGFKLGVAYADPWGHRGASHSVFFALATSTLLAVLLPNAFGSRVKTFILTALALASHGLLDALTTGGLGPALLWPFTDERYFFSWRPLPVAAIGARAFSGAGLKLMAIEAWRFLPLWVVAFWPQRLIFSERRR
jgi:inner membrane protein